MSPRGALDRWWMEQTIALAALVEWCTSPNPRVGCMLVQGDRVVGRGFHRAAGEPHAEAVAVAQAGEAARGSTAFVNLEPCDHQGRTPPCSELLVRAGVRRVVASLQDPNPLVDGRGFARLKAAGVEVEVGLGAEAAERINESFLHFHRSGRPLVTLKAALTLDGMIAASGGRARWISGEPARRFGHRWRARHDAILVGAGTVRADDPHLTVRLPGVEVERVRAVLAPSLDVPPAAKLFAGRGPRTRVYTGPKASREKEGLLAPQADVVRVGEDHRGLDLAAVLADLASCGVQSLLVEGGGRTHAKFLEAGLADRVALVLAPRLFGAHGGTPLLGCDSAADVDQGWRLTPTSQLALGSDLVLIGRVERSCSRG